MHILITGAGSGLGWATAAYFVQRGDRVYACDLCPPDAAENLIPLRGDITDTGTLEKLVQRLQNEGVVLDAILHFAGIFRMDNFLEAVPENLHRMVEVNLMGPILVNRFFFPLLVKNGRILITTSEVAPLDPLPFNGLYSMTKTALDCYAQALRQEVGLLGVRVITLRPGAFATPLSAGSIPSMQKMTATSRYYGQMAPRFARLMAMFTGKPAPPNKLAQKVWRVMHGRYPKNIYTLHANFGLKLLDLLPKGAQVRVVRWLIGQPGSPPF